MQSHIFLANTVFIFEDVTDLYTVAYKSYQSPYVISHHAFHVIKEISDSS